MTTEKKGLLADRKLMKVAASCGWQLRDGEVRANSLELGRAVEKAVLEVVVDAALGALAKGALGIDPPPHGHWMTPIWQAGRSASVNAVADFLATSKQYVTNDASRESALQAARCEALEQAAKLVEEGALMCRDATAAAIRSLMRNTDKDVAQAAVEFIATGPQVGQWVMNIDPFPFFAKKPKGSK